MIVKRRKRWKLRLLLALLICAGLLLLMRMRLDPLMQRMAAAQIESLLSDLINDAFSQEIAEQSLRYDEIISFQKDENGQILALQTNMVTVNQLKSEVIHRLNAEAENMTIDQLGIPLGNLLLPELLSGRGPRIPIRLTAITDSNAEFYNEFSEAGINQTLHRILLTVTMDATVLVPTGLVHVSAAYSAIVAETILIGFVPEYLTKIDHPRE